MKLVRDGQKVWPYCSECGCRLFYHRLWGVEYLAHKLTDSIKDSRGHECADLHEWWNVELGETHKILMDLNNG